MLNKCRLSALVIANLLLVACGAETDDGTEIVDTNPGGGTPVTPTPTPTPTPSVTPTPTPIVTPTPGTTPTPTPVVTPTPTPGATPTPTPTVTPTPGPTPTPVITPTPTPTPVITPTPTPTPVVTPTPTPTPVVTPTPTPTPVVTPTPTPTPIPSVDEALLSTVVSTVIEDESCAVCHTPGGLAGGTDFVVSAVTNDGVLSAITNFLEADYPAHLQVIKDKPNGIPSHVGGNIFGSKPTLSANWELLADQVAMTLEVTPTPTPTPTPIITPTPTPVVSESCENVDIAYGRRQMRLLSTSEYQNTIYDLIGYSVDANALGLPVDTEVEGFINQTLTPVTQGYADAFMSISQTVADWSAANDFNGVADCSDISISACSNLFVDEFGTKAFRRPLTAEEKTRYKALFSSSLSGGSSEVGLKLALRAMISSPNFLYRSEMGVKVSDIIDQINSGAGELTSGDNRVVLEGEALGTLNADGNREIPLYNNFGTSLQNFTFTGNDLITIVARGNEVDGAFPSLKLSVGNTDRGVQMLTSSFESYTFAIEDLVGSGQYMQLANDINGANHSGSRSLEIESITVSDAIVVVPNLPDPNLDLDSYILTPYELATFISYSYTGSTPDDLLLRAAANGELETDEQIIAQVERLLSTNKARDHFGDFAAQWLHSDDVLSANRSDPSFTADVRKAMAQEVREIVKHVMFDDNQPITNIYEDFSFLNDDLANFYGVSGNYGGDFVKVDSLLERGGILTSGALMAGFAHEDESSPIKRAVAVRENLLCQKVPPMPNNLDVEREDADGALATYIEEQGGKITNRERYAFLTKAPVCAGCHDEIINPHGFGMEDFDAVGLLRTADAHGLSIDASGQLIGLDTLSDGGVETFTGGVQLSQILQDLPAAESCYSEKTFRFFMGTGHDVFDHVADDAPVLSEDEKVGYACALDTMESAMSDNNSSALSALKALGLSTIIRYRQAQ